MVRPLDISHSSDEPISADSYNTDAELDDIRRSSMARRTDTNETLIYTTTTAATSPRTSGPEYFRSDNNHNNNISNRNSNKNPFDTDIEAMMSPIEGMPSVATSTSHPSRHHSGRACRKSLIEPTVNDCQIWPGKEHWKQQAKEARIRRSCTCLARLSKTSRNIVKVVIALLVIGVAVGVGVGISKALNAPIYGDKDNSPTR